MNRLRDWLLFPFAPVMAHCLMGFSLSRASLGMGSTFTNSDVNDFGQVAGEEIIIECGNGKAHQR
jgi:hypothetical protein